MESQNTFWITVWQATIIATFACAIFIIVKTAIRIDSVKKLLVILFGMLGLFAYLIYFLYYLYELDGVHSSYHSVTFKEGIWPIGISIILVLFYRFVGNFICTRK